MRSTCPESVVIIEPILNALSALLPCDISGETHIIVLPITFKYYNSIKQVLPTKPDSVVCIGCDSHYGPNRYDKLGSKYRCK